jgi:hypothetical protein
VSNRRHSLGFEKATDRQFLDYATFGENKRILAIMTEDTQQGLGWGMGIQRVVIGVKRK